MTVPSDVDRAAPLIAHQIEIEAPLEKVWQLHVDVNAWPSWQSDITAVGPGSIMLIPAGVEHYIEPIVDETVENIDVFAPARSDYLHLLEWMRSRSNA
jgi:hypothetical protein